MQMYFLWERGSIRRLPATYSHLDEPTLPYYITYNWITGFMLFSDWIRTYSTQQNLDSFFFSFFFFRLLIILDGKHYATNILNKKSNADEQSIIQWTQSEA